MTDDELRMLAKVAVVTPSLDAQDALAVLADALLERGLIFAEPEPEPEPELDRKPFFTTAYRTVLQQAWDWANETTALPLLERMLRDMLEVTRRLKAQGDRGDPLTFHPRSFVVPPHLYRLIRPHGDG